MARDLNVGILKTGKRNEVEVEVDGQLSQDRICPDICISTLARLFIIFQLALFCW